MQCEIGMVGLGVMGRNLLLNMADHGFSVAGYDLDASKVEALRKEANGSNILGTIDIKLFIESLKLPRAIILLVPAGAPVDAVIKALIPYLQKGDTIIDAGNSYFKDTNLRSQELLQKGIQFLGVGVSGGEEGARHGPSLMPGGPKEVYERVRPVFEAVAAKVNNEPCVSYLGPESAGHFVKMVHNGIEYGMMQLISETYDLMKRGLGLNNDELHHVYAEWNKGELNSFLLEITSLIFLKKDEKTGNRLIDEILDVAKQKGTGRWTSQTAMELNIPTPTIDLAVSMRDLSMQLDERNKAKAIYKCPESLLKEDKQVFIKHLSKALYAAIVTVYSQGFAILAEASEKLNYHLNLETIARIWRGGCIIRATLLEEIRTAFTNEPKLRNLLLDPNLSKKIMIYEGDLAHVIKAGIEASIPLPGFMTALSCIDGYRCGWLPLNLIQAQRDFFGAHTYERLDSKGAFHTQWE